jgi:hypothetical protein
MNRRTPTPGELAAFIRATDETRIALDDFKGYQAAVAAWRRSEDLIAAAEKFWEDYDRDHTKRLVRVSYAEALKLLGTPRIVRSYWDEIFWLLPPDWMDRKINGFPQGEISQMQIEQKRRRTERARTAAQKKHSK